MYSFKKFWSRVRGTIPVESQMKLVCTTTYEVKQVVVLDIRAYHEVKIDDWLLGNFWYDDQRGHMVSLGMQTKIIRNGGLLTCGWNGDETHIATVCKIQPGDVLEFDRVFDHTRAPKVNQIHIENV